MSAEFARFEVPVTRGSVEPPRRFQQVALARDRVLRNTRYHFSLGEAGPNLLHRQVCSLHTFPPRTYEVLAGDRVKVQRVASRRIVRSGPSIVTGTIRSRSRVTKRTTGTPNGHLTANGSTSSAIVRAAWASGVSLSTRRRERRGATRSRWRLPHGTSRTSASRRTEVSPRI